MKKTDEIVTVYRIEANYGIQPELLSARATRTPKGYRLLSGEKLSWWHKKLFTSDDVFESAELALSNFEGRESERKQTYELCAERSQAKIAWAQEMRKKLK